MKGERATSILVVMILLVIVLGPTALGKSDLTDPNRYLNAVREFADNVLKHDRDTYNVNRMWIRRIGD